MGTAPSALRQSSALDRSKERPVIDPAALDQLFLNARTHQGWLDRPVSPDLLRRAVDLAVLGPTSANSLPMRIVFAQSKAAKERLLPALFPANVDKTMSAPVTAIIAYDLAFHDHTPRLFPHKPEIQQAFRGNPAFAEETAVRNGTLQGGYFILAARALGLDCGPMSGFDRQKVDAAFFAGTLVRSNFLCNVGYGDESTLFPRHPRFDFNEIAQIL